MNSTNSFPGFVCTTREHAYQVLSDERYLYFVCLGKPDEPDVNKAVQSPEDIQPCITNVRISKAGIVSVNCRQSGERLAVQIAMGEKTYSVEADASVEDDVLLEVFDELKVHLSRHNGAPAKRPGDRVDAALFAFGFLLALAAIGLKKAFPNVNAAQYLTLGWMAVPMIWLTRCGRRERAGKNGFAMDLGAMASLFSCVFLWLSPVGRPDRWGPVIIPALVIALAAAAVYVWAARKIRPVQAAAVFVAAALLYAPGAARCLNEMLPVKVAQTAASVVEINSMYSEGDWRYYAVLEVDGVQMMHALSREEYNRISEQDAVYIEQRMGSLGISWTDVVFGIGEE